MTLLISLLRLTNIHISHLTFNLKNVIYFLTRNISLRKVKFYVKYILSNNLLYINWNSVIYKNISEIEILSKCMRVQLLATRDRVQFLLAVGAK